MKAIVKILGLLVIILMFGCKTAQVPPIKEVPIQYKEKIVERLVPVELPADSTNLLALFECDSTNKVILKELTEAKSKRIQSLFSFNDGLLKYNAKAIPDKAYVPVKDTSKEKEVPVIVNVPFEVNKLTDIQIIEIYAGRLLLGLLLGYGIYKLFKWKGTVITTLIKSFIK